MTFKILQINEGSNTNFHILISMWMYTHAYIMIFKYKYIILFLDLFWLYRKET